MTTTWHGDPRPPSGSPVPAGARPGAAPGAPASGDPAPAPGIEPSGGGAGERAAPGSVIGGRYALRTAIGHGGMGTVWRATDTVLRREVAVKEVLLPPGLAPADRDAMYQRTLREARAAAALSHPAVVQVYDVVTHDQRPWIVMELLQARSLAEMIVEDGPLAPRAVAKIGIALLGALEIAHAAGVLHRDVKPANVLICSDGRCVLTDFGVARMPTDADLTAPGMVLGSPHFISPERAVGARFGPPSDLFSLGVTLYTAVEGRPPFDRPDPFETMRAVVEEPPAPAMRAGALAGVLYGLLEKQPHRRWDVHTARSVLRQLLVGPLASSATLVQGTDPYAVVRPAAWTPPTAPQATRQVGGRAMLAPGESVTDALRRHHGTDSARSATPSTRRSADPDATEVGRVVTDPNPDAPPVTGGAARPTSGGPARPTSGGPAGPAGAAAPARPTAGHAVGTGRRLPRWAHLALVGAAAALLLFGVATATGWLGGGGPSGAEPAQFRSNPPASGPLLPVQEHRDDRGFVVNVPQGWTRKATRTSYVDYVDPVDANRRLRINVEAAGGTVRAFAEVAESGLRRRTDICAAPYQRVALRDNLTLAGRPAAELEYTCGQAELMRHGVWRFTVQEGKAYQFFLTVPQARFSESRVVYDEMVRSYRFLS